MDKPMLTNEERYTRHGRLFRERRMRIVQLESVMIVDVLNF